MEEGDGTGTLTDETWASWEPLIEAARPRGKTPPHDLRRTIAAIFWRHENGTEWRSIPAELGPWWRMAQLFIRWAKLDVWERLLELLLAPAMLDSLSAIPWRVMTGRLRVEHLL